jgi:hypothetical protein
MTLGRDERRHGSKSRLGRLVIVVPPMARESPSTPGEDTF